MKQALFIAAVLGSLVLGANAFALTTDYSQIFTYSAPVTLSGAKASTTFTFGGITNSFVGTPTLSIALKGDSQNHNFTDGLYLTIANNKITEINRNSLVNGLYSYTFNPGTLGSLNSAIRNNSVSFTLLRSSGTSIISSATLKGTVAPEPVSMALVGAGLVGLPFARRLRKSFK